MSSNKLRTIIAAVVFIVLSVGLVAGVSMGTLSGFGWDTFAVLCPLGALATMISTHTIIPRAVISLIALALIVFVVGRAFCGWLCPVPLVGRIRDFFRTPKKRAALKQAKQDDMLNIAKRELDCGHACESCGTCAEKRAKFDSRHAVLGGALLSTAIFGFPVFCLVCPVGLTFATVLVVWRLFSAGDMTWSVVLIPLLLVVEVLFLRKWCTRFCPLAGMMNLVSRFSKTYVPVIDDAKCLETTVGAPCSQCAVVCDADINLRHPDFGERTLADCTRCRACVEACPAHAVSIPFRVRKNAAGASVVEVTETVDKAGL